MALAVKNPPAQAGDLRDTSLTPGSGRQPVHPKGNQSWVFIGRIDIEAEIPILWPPHAKS